MISTRLTKALEIEHPIIQAPMAFAAGGALASAVSKAGGLGLIGGGYGDEQWLNAQFRAAGNERIGCGFITWSLANNPALLTQALARNPSHIFLSFGDPSQFAAEIQAANVDLICQVQTLEHAHQALDAGAKIIVAQGSEAGGHGQSRATMTLVPEIADLLAAKNSDALLCGAGGIADGRGLAAALMLGADGVLIGSRFWACNEALVSPQMHQAAIAASGDDTIRSDVMDVVRDRDWPEPFNCRVLHNGFTQRWHGYADELKNDQNAKDAWAKAWVEGDPKGANTFVGEATGLIAEILPARMIIETIVESAATLLAGTNYVKPSRN